MNPTVKPALKPWEIGQLSAEREALMNSNNGRHFTNLQKHELGKSYFDKVLKVKPQHSSTLLYRSICRRKTAQTQDALQDSLVSKKLHPNHPYVCKEHADVLYELNRFEDCKAELHNDLNTCSRSKRGLFEKRLHAVNANFQDALNESVVPFLSKHKEVVEEVGRQIKKERIFDERPTWKIRRDEQSCDVQSIQDKEEIILSPLEIARRERSYCVFNQTYFHKNHKDIKFLRDLCNDSRLMLPQCHYSTPYLCNLVHSKYQEVKNFEKMLHARSPLYNERIRMCAHKQFCEDRRQTTLYIVQNQTRRNAFAKLRQIHKLRAEGNLKALFKCVEEFMGSYIVAKTHRILPWKMELIFEVYNILGLAIADTYTIPNTVLSTLEMSPMKQLLKIPQEKSVRTNKFTFGDKRSLLDPESTDHDQLKHKKLIRRLEVRLRFATLPIERSYLLYEMARSSLQYGNFDECCRLANKAVEEAKLGRSHLWAFLSYMLMLKAHTILNKVESSKEAIERLLEVVPHLQCPRLTAFSELCYIINGEDLNAKQKLSIKIESPKRHRSSVEHLRKLALDAEQKENQRLNEVRRVEAEKMSAARRSQYNIIDSSKAAKRSSTEEADSLKYQKELDQQILDLIIT